MTALPKPAFERALASLDRDEFVAFVGALWAARGYRTEQGTHPGVVIATHPTLPDRVLYVPGGDTTGRRDTGTVELPDGVEQDDVTTVVAATTAPGPGDGVTDCLDAESLYELAMYAIDRDALADLCRSHFGESPASLAADSARRDDTRPWRSTVTGWAEFGHSPRVAALGVLILSVVLATTLAWVGGAGLGTSPGASTPDAGTADAESALATTPDGAIVESTCPDPPTGVSARDLGPALDSDALDGWRLDGSRVVSIFDLMNRSQEATPEESFVGTYVGPDGRAYELRISRWEDPSTARGEAPDRRARWPVWEVWGAYSFGVRGVAPDGTVPSTSLTRGAARELLAAIETPGGNSLAACVDDLVEDRG